MAAPDPNSRGLAAGMPAVPPALPPINYKGTPFYSQISPAKYNEFTIPLVTIPPGTLLFRGIAIPDMDKNDDPRRFFTEFLGAPEGNVMCLTPQHNTFFYPLPFVPFGTHTVGNKFNAIHVYVTTRPLNVVSAIAPSPWSRGSPKKWAITEDMPWTRCDTFSQWCHELSYIERMSLQYDNCLNPTYAKASGTRGWMAVADLDSLKPYKLRESTAKESPMGGYLAKLSERQPDLAYELVTQTYVDERKHTGYPEIALFPLKTHPGNTVIKRPARDERAVMKHMEDLARANELNFLPLATITAEGVADMITGDYTLRTLPGVVPYRNRPRTAANTRPPAAEYNPPQLEKQPSIEEHLKAYLETLKSEGLKLPFYGVGSLSFDTRTGFYVLPQMIPKDLVVRGEKPADLVQYNSLLIRLTTPELRQRVTDYTVLFRTYLPQKYMTKFPLAKGFGIRRAFIFSRPGFFKRWFEELGFEIPPTLDELGKRASRLFEQNTGRREAKKAAAKAKTAAAGAGAADEEGGHTPPLYEPAPAGPKTPDYTGAPPAGAAATEGEGGRTPKTPEFSGGAGGIRGRSRTRGRKRAQKRKTRRRAHGTKAAYAIHTPLTQAQHVALQGYAKIYKSVWSALGKGPSASK